jgi:hypothetical protein
MEEIIGSWIGHTVSVTLKVGGIATAVTFEGKLVNVGDGGLLLELAKGQTFVPEHSILHVSLLNSK